jgi:CRISPR-associated endonuclease/helicase Cas3
LVDRFRESSGHIDTLATTGINGIRNEIYEKAIRKIEEVPLKRHIFTLTAPTGTGKTLTALSCALKLRKRIKDYKPRIIYSLPFTSIIDQNYEIIRDVLKQLPEFSRNESNYLLKHHHLADLRYKVEDEERPIEESLLLVESWEAEIVVTTFIQFLHSIIGFKNRFLKKYHNIAGSIILLDEVQNIPIEYWPLINRVFIKLLIERLKCYIILLTATRPLIFDEQEIIPLIEDNKCFFHQMDRITLIPKLKEITIDEFFQEFIGLYNKKMSYLIVLNTIKSSIEFHNMIQKSALFEDLVKNGRVFYLSTNIIPKERARRIKAIDELISKGEKIIIVSTQVIEAGIDIDMDVVIRDIGPVDSIVQVSGRCNRGMRRGKGKVFLFNLVYNHRSYARLVYGAVHCGVSLDLLKEEAIEESQFYELIEEYFTTVASKKDQRKSEDIWEAIKQFRFYHPENLKSISEFRIIEEKSGYADVFVEANEEARKIWETYVTEVIREKDLIKRRMKYLLIRNEFNSYVVSVPKRLIRDLDIDDRSLVRIPYEQINFYYNYQTGFIRGGDQEASFIF